MLFQNNNTETRQTESACTRGTLDKTNKGETIKTDGRKHLFVGGFQLVVQCTCQETPGERRTRTSQVRQCIFLSVFLISVLQISSVHNQNVELLQVIMFKLVQSLFLVRPVFNVKRSLTNTPQWSHQCEYFCKSLQKISFVSERRCLADLLGVPSFRLR